MNKQIEKPAKEAKEPGVCGLQVVEKGSFQILKGTVIFMCGEAHN